MKEIEGTIAFEVNSRRRYFERLLQYFLERLCFKILHVTIILLLFSLINQKYLMYIVDYKQLLPTPFIIWKNQYSNMGGENLDSCTCKLLNIEFLGENSSTSWIWIHVHCISFMQ
jgi:hypothetical protein